MFNELLKNKIIVEMKKLIEKVESEESYIDAYSEFMRETILNTYSEN